MVTLRDVSRAAGVSVTQTSRALGGHDDVSEATRARVAAAAERLGYRANTLARGLRTGRSGIVAMVVPERHEAAAVLLLEVVMGLSRAVSARGLRFVLHVAPEGEGEADVHEALWRGGGIDGFLLIHPRPHDPRAARLLKLGAPFAMHGRGAGSGPWVDIDNAAAGRLPAEHLRAQGHRRILFLDGPAEEPFAQARAEAFAAAAGAGAAITHGPMTESRALREVAHALDRPGRPTAILAGNALLARGVYGAAHAAGLTIPNDLAVLAHDDGLENHAFEGFAPPLGGTRAPLREAWDALSVAIAARIASPGRTAETLTLPVTFDPGASTAPPLST